MIPSGFIRNYLCFILGLPIDSDAQVIIDKFNEVKRELEKMYKKKNYEKFDNHDDAIKAFEAMCFNRKCADCQYSPNNNPYHCEIRWLYDEAKSNEYNTNNKEENNEE